MDAHTHKHLKKRSVCDQYDVHATDEIDNKINYGSRKDASENLYWK